MIEVPVFNRLGGVEYVLELPEDVQPVSGRTSKSKSLYYKGVGVAYTGHSSLNVDDFEDHGESSIFYYGWNVLNNNWKNKFGIFQATFQPFFSDFVGTCGKKELNIIFNSRQFKYSAVSVKDAIEHDADNQQFYFVLDYSSPRVKYFDNSVGLFNLLSYMVSEGWNFPWDKTSINDINNYGYVTDVADMFKSFEDTHAFGTVYSVLYSLFTSNKQGYLNFLKLLNCARVDLSDLPFIVLLFLRYCGRECYVRSDLKTMDQLYVYLVGNILLRGRNCAGVEDINQSNSVMIQYLDRFKKQLGEDDLSVLEVY